MKRRPRRSAESRIGERYGRLVIVEIVSPRGEPRSVLCICDCGNERVLLLGNIAQGLSRSCGCLLKEARRFANLKHGESSSRLWAVWQKMKSRCSNPKDKAYRHYGARDITVCDRWQASYEAFRADMGQRPSKAHSLGRIDNDGPYSPENCRWETPRQQARNTRRNVWLEHDGRRMLATDVASELGISRQAVQQRIKAGHTPEEICSWPARKHHEHRAHRCSICGEIGHYRTTCERKRKAA